MLSPSARHRSVNEHAFDTIYKQRKWGGDGLRSSLSGSGSSLSESRNLCALLVGQVALVARRRQSTTVSLLDAAMGDLFWMSHCLPKIARALPDDTRLLYQGVDVAPMAIAIAEQRRLVIAAKLGRSVSIAPFKQLDLAELGSIHALPLRSYDVVICNDALMHLPIRDIFTALTNMNSVGGSLFITNSAVRPRITTLRLTRNAKTGRNQVSNRRESLGPINGEIRPGEHRGIDLKLHPFSLGGVQHSVASSTDNELLEVWPFPLLLRNNS